MRGLTAFLAGLLFGMGLLLAGMANPAKVQAFLDLAGAWDPSLALVMVGAIADAQRMITNHIGRQADRHIGSGFCRACKRPCSGALNDRLRTAYCEACYKRWKRGADAEGNRPDRAYFERLTPAWDAPPEQDTGT